MKNELDGHCGWQRELDNDGGGRNFCRGRHRGFGARRRQIERFVNESRIILVQFRREGFRFLAGEELFALAETGFGFGFPADYVSVVHSCFCIAHENSNAYGEERSKKAE